MNIYDERLLNVAKALEESPTPDAFMMELFTHHGSGDHPCGTPACALGHYAARKDLQNAYDISPTGYIETLDEDGVFSDRCPFNVAREHFDLSKDEADELFDAGGCGNAQTIHEASSYIRKFVAERQAAQGES